MLSLRIWQSSPKVTSHQLVSSSVNFVTANERLVAHKATINCHKSTTSGWQPNVSATEFSRVGLIIIATSWKGQTFAFRKVDLSKLGSFGADFKNNDLAVNYKTTTKIFLELRKTPSQTEVIFVWSVELSLRVGYSPKLFRSSIYMYMYCIFLS